MSGSYHPVSKSFHWLVAGMLLIQFCLGWLMPEVRGGSPAAMVSFHMEFGIAILFVMLLRLTWRLAYGAPEPEPMSDMQEHIARWTHYALYATVVALPFTGWLLASARGWTINIFGLFTMPALVAANRSMSRLADTLHVGFVTVACGLIAVHAAAALYHHFVEHDRVLTRMLP